MTARPHRTRMVPLLIALAVIAAACGNDGGSSDVSGQSERSSTSEGEEAEGGSEFNQAQFAGEPRDGGAITFGVESEIASLDPCGEIAQPSDVLGALAIYDPLLDYDAEGNLTGSLATSWESSDEFSTWTIGLREGVTFNDGTPFNAAAVAAHFERLGDPANACGSLDRAEKITTIETPDDRTVTFRLSEPNSMFAYQLASNFGFIESPTAVEELGEDFARNPVGTGPFALESFESLEFSANPDYWKTDDEDRQLPHLDRLTLRPIPDAANRLRALEQGEVDMIQTAASNTIVDAVDAGLNVQKVTGASSTILQFNTAKPPFDNLKLRQAVAHAIDRRALNQVQYDGTRALAYTSYPPSHPFHSEAAREEVPKYDPERARQLVSELEAAGEPTSAAGLCIPTPEGRTIFGVVQEQLAEVGIDIETRFVDQGAFVNQIISKTGDYELACFRTGPAAAPSDPDNTVRTGAPGNTTFYSNDRVDGLVEEILRTDDTQAQIENVKQIEEIVFGDLPIVPLLYDLFANVYRNDVSGLTTPEQWSLGAIEPASLYLRQDA